MARRVQEELDLEAEFERSSQRVEEERVKKAREPGLKEDWGQVSLRELTPLHLE